MIVTKFRTDTRGSHLAAAPSLDAQRKSQRRLPLPVLDVADPAGARLGQAKLDRALSEGQVPFGSNREEGHSGRRSFRMNTTSSRSVQKLLTDLGSFRSDNLNMAAPDGPDWYLRDWFATMGLIQRDLVTKLDWLPATAHRVWHGLQQYRRQDVAEVSALLNIQPFELLMPPEEAMALRRMRATLAEVARAEAPALATVADTPRTGTDG